MYVTRSYFSLGMIGSQIAILSLVALQMLIECYHSASDAKHVCGYSRLRSNYLTLRLVYDTFFKRIKNNFDLFYYTKDK